MVSLLSPPHRLAERPLVVSPQPIRRCQRTVRQARWGNREPVESFHGEITERDPAAYAKIRGAMEGRRLTGARKGRPMKRASFRPKN
jgi:hypothetical protein